jgi:hypothetical protein
MPTQDIPFEQLGIPPEFDKHVLPDTPRPVRLAVARGALPVAIDVQLGFCVVLSGDEDAEVQKAALDTVRGMPTDLLKRSLGSRTHAKALELLATLKPDDQALGEAIFAIRNMNERTACLIASHAQPPLCERIVYNHERLLMNPSVWNALYDNPNCPDAILEKASSFLRLHKLLPQADHPRPGAAALKSTGVNLDLEAEIEAALRGEASPALKARSDELAMFDLSALEGEENPLKDFKLDFRDESSEFGWDMLDDSIDLSQDERATLEKRILAMSVGQRVKLAYVGNKAVRSVLVRDVNKLVSVAVVRSGRCSDGEVASFASNRNLSDDVMREIAANPEFTRKYPVKVALVNNPKTPVSAAVAIVAQLNRKDLNDLCHNHNISSVIAQMAKRLFRQKYQS